MNKPAPLVSKSPFVSEQYTALWEATMQRAKAKASADFWTAFWTETAEATCAQVAHRFSFDWVCDVPSTVDMLKRLGYKIVKVTE